MLENLHLNEHLLILSRLVLAALLAFIPGIERELTGKFAGLRTHILVSLGACVFTVLSIYGFKMHEVAGFVGTNDPARIAAQVITGIGFIGAGTVMRHGSNVFGITTAATLWVCAAIGMCCGCGQYLTAIFTAIVTLIVLILIRRLEKDLISYKKVHYIPYNVQLHLSINDCEAVQDIFTQNFHKIYKFQKKLLTNDELKVNAVITTKKPLKEINDTFKNIHSIKSIEVSENYD